MIYLVTGVAGFIGANLAKRILNENNNIKVIGLDNMNDYYDIKLKEYRLKELEEKVNKHNNLIERTYQLEKQVAIIQEEIKE